MLPSRISGEFRITFGRFKGQRLKEIPLPEMLYYIQHLEADTKENRLPVSTELTFLKKAFGKYCTDLEKEKNP
jgi:hypothetical protein